TSIKYVHFYDLPDVEVDEKYAATEWGYPLYSGLKTVALNENTFAPSAAAYKVGTYKITGLDSNKSYNFSSDGKTWTVISNVTEITGLEIGKYYIQECAFATDAAYEIFTFDIKGANEFEGTPVADGLSIIGLDASVQYEYTTVTKLGTGEWVSAPAGTTKLENLENGLYAIRVKASDGFFVSLEKLVLVYDGETDRTDIIYYDSALGKKAVYTSGEGNNLPFDIGYWSSTNYKVTDHNSSHGNASYAAIRNSGFALATDDATAFGQLLAVNNTYAMKPHQIVDINSIKSIHIGHAFIGVHGNAVLEGGTKSMYTAKLRIFVTGSDVEYYDIDHAWDENVILDNKLPEDAHGYVTALQFFPFSFIPEGAHVQDEYKDHNPEEKYSGRYVPGFVYLYDYQLKGIETIDAEAIVTEAYLDSYRIAGLDTSKAYAYSTDEISWTNIPAGASYVQVDAGTYYLKALGQNGDLDSEVISVTINGVQPTVTGLSISEGVITGFEADKSYEYRAVNAMNDEWIAIEAGTTELTVEAGVWAVRFAGADALVAGAPQYLMNRGGSFGSIAWGKFSRDSAGFIQGYWTSTTKTIYNDNFVDTQLDGDDATTTRPRFAQNWTAKYDDRLNLVYKYAFENSEVLPIQNLGCLKVSMIFGASNPVVASSCVALFRVHVEGGNAPYYDVTVNHTFNWTMFEVDFLSSIPSNAKGYVTAIEVFPMYDVVGLISIAEANRYPVFRIANYDSNSELDVKSAEKWRVSIYANAAPTASDFELKLEENNRFIPTYVLSGFEPGVAYEVVDPMGMPVTFEEGTTEISVIAGTYKIRYAETEMSPASAYLKYTVPLANPVFSKNAHSYYPYVLGNEFVDGKWANSLASWNTGESEINSKVESNIVLSTASYKYQFAESERFTVDEHPYFSIDFNNELLNMGIETPYISGAVMTVDIYVEGEDEPYSVTGEWKGKDAVNGFTLNKITVNLLEEYPELMGKTVRAFDIRPYSNLDTTPNDYNTTATAARYFFFRLRYVGFFDSPANINAVVTDECQRVNSLTGIEADTNVIYALGATPNASDFTVYEVYSDGTKIEIDYVTIETDEGFAAESGIDTVTVKARGVETTVDVIIGLDHIEIQTLPEKTAYYDGDEVDLSGIELVAVLENGESVAIDDGYAATVDTVKLGDTSITVVFGGKEASFDITVEEVVLESIQLNNFPVKHVEGSYVEGDEIDLTGLAILATYNNGDKVVVGLEDLEWKYSAEAMVRGGVLTITYGGKTISGIVLAVVGRAISEIAITNPAEKTIYMAGEELDITGLELTVNYEDGTSEVVTEGFIADADLSEAGEVVVSILYEGFTLEYTVIVRTIDSAFIMTPPTKTEYVVGEELDIEGLELYVLYSDGEEAYLTEGFEL
ncbi:MAG: bacterial Ig-like domain-containing protein, partial [Clostridia bacterium]|nr:bacterial Ig-like domain-containing protein [Clostridia bacterium]